jgi:hypothetical protein
LILADKKQQGLKTDVERQSAKRVQASCEVRSQNSSRESRETGVVVE